jgi:hypothetical protein
MSYEAFWLTTDAKRPTADAQMKFRVSVEILESNSLEAMMETVDMNQRQKRIKFLEAERVEIEEELELLRQMVSETADGKTADGKTADGQTADGETADGKEADGKEAEAEGEMAGGETAKTAERETAERQTVGQTAERETAVVSAVTADADADAIPSPEMEMEAMEVSAASE